MNIRYIRSNIKKLNGDNLIKFLYDLTFQDVQNVDSYEEGNIYHEEDRIYLQNNNIHQVFQCIVPESSNTFIEDEWEFILDINTDNITNISNLVIKEEMHIITEDNRTTIQTNLNFKYENSTFAVYCGKKRYCLNHDFEIIDNNINFIKPFNIGDKVILEVRECIGIPVGLVLRSTNGLDYETIVIDNELFIFVSERKGRDEILIRDIITHENYRLFMIDEDMYYETTTINTTKSDIQVDDENRNKRKIEMIDGELYYDIAYEDEII